MTTITEIMARLGHACGLEWARCPAVSTYDSRPCMREVGHVKPYCLRDSGQPFKSHLRTITLPPTLAEWQAEHEREHPGEPGPVASWTSEDGRVSWDVFRTMRLAGGGEVVRINVRVGNAIAWCDSGGPWGFAGEAFTADWAECVRLMQAADGGGG